MPFDPITYLKGRHTKQLLRLRDQIYAVNGGNSLQLTYHNLDGYELNPERCMLVSVGEKNSGMCVSLKQVKAELRTREHVPNKVEACEIRRAKAKAQRNR